jgi:hypothetical protein
MAGGNQVLDDCRAHPTRRPSDEYMHNKSSGFWLEPVSTLRLFW